LSENGSSNTTNGNNYGKQKYFAYLPPIIVMKIGVLKEPSIENRVSLLPEHIALFTKLNCEVLVEIDAGLKASASNSDYANANASVTNRAEVLAASDILLAIHSIAYDEIVTTKAQVILGVFQPLVNAAQIQKWASSIQAVFSMDMLPRTTRAQSMDVLSSQANIAGYKAVLTAATSFGKYLPMFTTAAGSIAPAKVLILGAGVAGLQAIATAKRLGAVVEVFDTRPQVKEEVMSLGAKFVEVEGAADASKAGGYAVEQTEEYKQKQQAKIAESVAKADIIITTAAIPGKKAPILITNAMLDAMKNGSIIVDLAASTGGNTELTKNNEVTTYKNVTIIGNSNLQSTMPSDASKLYGKNIANFLQLIISKEGTLNLNFEDDLVAGTCIAHEGKIVNERVAALL
jgi:H+-translocating NAD(P) transhydrogenase subunit alpha